MRGERGPQGISTPTGVGSSPHARGTHRIRATVHDGRRFIPACAGNARCIRARTQGSAVHPRMRGERAIPGVDATWIAGSSPHARGTPVGGRHVDTDQRFIPACAGNATTWVSPASVRPVHPRMRGERRHRCGQHRLKTGSSPHARGTLIRPVQERPCGRFIPACAGNARCIRARTRGSAVHPRMRGERIHRLQTPILGVGSSPHARGTLH